MAPQRGEKKRQRRLKRAANVVRNKQHELTTYAMQHPGAMGGELQHMTPDGVRMETPEAQERLDGMVDGIAQEIEKGSEIDPDVAATFRGWLLKLKAGRAGIAALQQEPAENQLVAMPVIQIATSYSAWSRLGPKARQFFTDLLIEVGLQPPVPATEVHDLARFNKALERGDPEAMAANDEINAAWKDWLVNEISKNKTAAEEDAKYQRITRRQAQRALRRVDPSWSPIQKQTWATLWRLVDNPDMFNRLSESSKNAVAEILTEVGFRADQNPQLARLNDAVSQRMAHEGVRTFDPEITRQHTPQGHPQSWLSQGRTFGDLQALSDSLDVLADVTEKEQLTKLAALLAERPEVTDAEIAKHYTEQTGTTVTPNMVRHVRERYAPGTTYRLPDGMQLGDPIYGDDKLIGHVDARGDCISLVTPEAEEFRVPVVLDGPQAKDVLGQAKVTPDKEVTIRIGGPPRKLEADEPTRQASLQSIADNMVDKGLRQGEKLIHDADEVRHSFAPASLGTFEVNASGTLSFAVLIDGKEVVLTSREPDVVNTFLDDRAAGKSMAETVCQLAERLSDKGQERYFRAAINVEGDPIARAIQEMHGERPQRANGPARISVETLARAIVKASYDESYQKNERELGKLAAEWTNAGGTLEDFSKALADEPNGRPVSARQLELMKQEYLTSGQGIREAVGGRVEAGMCDFCDGAGAAAWVYPAEDFAMSTPDGLPWHSGGAWLACAQCATLIENDDRVGLSNRYLATKPKAFHDVLRPWVIRLHNQFVRRRTGDRFRYERPSVGGGEIQVMSADDAEALGYHDLAARVRESGDVMMSVEDEHGNLEVIAEGQERVDMRLERRSLANGYINHPLINRLRQHIAQSEQATGMWHSTEPWQVLAEKYSMTMSAAASLGLTLGPDSPGTMYFDPLLVKAGLQDNPAYADELGLSIARSLHDAVPYLWLRKVDELAAEGELPEHTITRDLLPDPVMFWSFEDAFGLPEARVDWMLIRTSPHGYEVWCPQADDVRRPGSIMITGMLVGYGKRWPTDFRGPSADLADFLLKRISFVTSKYVDVPRVVAARHVRRDVERQIKPGMVKPPEDLAAYVVHLRERVQPLVVGGEPGDGPSREYAHHWYRRAHRRVLHRNTEMERVTWVKRHLVGDPNKPLLKNKVKVVSR
jgi:hypothetical protein